MVAATDPRGHWLPIWTAALALVAAVVGIRVRSASTLAVLLTALTLVLSSTPPLLVMIASLCATGYLVTSHLRTANTVAPTRITVLAAVGFDLVAAAPRLHPFDVAWLPLLAPLALLSAFAIVMYPYLRYSRRR
jgi:hypothetical protein